MSQLRIGFFGLPLAALLLNRDGHDVRWAVLSPMDAPGRRRLCSLLAPDRVVDLLVDSNERASLDDFCFERHVDTLLDAAPVDLIVSWYFTRRIPERWLSQPRLGAMGAHPSLLPRYRGPNPFYWAIDSGDVDTGITVHRLQADYDTGAILAQRHLLVGERNAWQLARALDRPSLGALREVVGEWAAGRFRAEQNQNAELATWAPEPSGNQLKVDWNWPTERILRRIRALAPVPGLALELNGQRFFVTAAKTVLEYPTILPLSPGEAFLGSRLILRTVDGALSVERAQMAPEDAGDSTNSFSDSGISGHEIRGQTLADVLRVRK
jgi:methionyl-tRNA formyltransferase